MSTERRLIGDRLREVFAMAMIGDGVLTLVDRERHLMLWYRGPAAWRRLVAPLVRSPALTAVAAVTGIGLGVWLAARQDAV